MRDTLKAQCVLEAITQYNESKAIHDKARDAFEGYSWGYYGREYIYNMERDAEVFQEQFRDFLKEQIDALNLNNTVSNTAST